MKDSGVLAKTALVFGQMNEVPGARARVGLTGLTMAESLRDSEGGKDVLFLWTMCFALPKLDRRYHHCWDEYLQR